MRIAHVSDFYLPRLGGIETQVASLAAHQRDAGDHADVITGHGFEEDTSARGGVRSVARRDGAFARMRPSSIRAAAAAVRTGGYDVAHVHTGLVTPLAMSTAAAAARAGIPTVVTVHSIVSFLAPVYRGLDVVGRWTRWPVAWTAVSEAAADPLRRLLPHECRVDVLYNAVDVRHWQVDPLPRDQQHVVVVAVMRLAPRKRPLHLLRVLRRVRRVTPKDVRISALVIGSGPQRRLLEWYVARHGMGNWVTLPGRFDHERIRAVYRRADVFVAPANLESFGIAALEARAAGLPVVAKAGTGVGEFIQDGRSGLLVDTDASMVDALTLLATDAGLRSGMAAHNRAVPPSFGWPRALRGARAAYQRAAALQGCHAGTAPDDHATVVGHTPRRLLENAS